MKDFSKRQLLINYLLGLCTPGEIREVEHWLDKEPANISLLQKVAKEIDDKGLLSDADKKHIKSKIFQEIREGDLSSEKEKSLSKVTINSRSSGNKQQSGLWYKVAAMVLVIVTAGMVGLYYTGFNSSQSESDTQLQQRTLSNGQTATFRFGDGSVIKLNAGSTLRYPEKFSENKREIYLEGEGFFNINRDESRPFIVHAGNTTTRVLGTSFNVRAYSEEKNVQIAVAEGKVAVSREEKEIESEDGDEAIYVEENQWVTYRSSEKLIEKGEGDIGELIAWKDRKLVFTDKSLVQISDRLERWYNIDIILADSTLKQRRMSASFEEESMTEVLGVIALALDLDYEKEGRKVTFTNKEDN